MFVFNALKLLYRSHHNELVRGRRRAVHTSTIRDWYESNYAET